MHMFDVFLRLFVALCVCLPVSVPAWELTDSRLGFRATAEGESFDAWFNEFTIRPSIDGIQPSAFEVEIRLDSVDSGFSDRDIEMRGPDWLDVEGHPVARFQSTSVEPAADGGFVTHGGLTLKGVDRTLAVPFTWEVSEHRLAMRGMVDVDRRWFGVGPMEDDAVAPGVIVTFEFIWVRDDG